MTSPSWWHFLPPVSPRPFCFLPFSFTFFFSPLETFHSSLVMYILCPHVLSSSSCFSLMSRHARDCNLGFSFGGVYHLHPTRSTIKPSPDEYPLLQTASWTWRRTESSADIEESAHDLSLFSSLFPLSLFTLFASFLPFHLSFLEQDGILCFPQGCFTGRAIWRLQLQCMGLGGIEDGHETSHGV